MNSSITFQKAALENFEDFYELKCEKENINWSGFKEKPDSDKLKEWYLKQLENKEKLFFLAYLNDNNERVFAAYLTIVLHEDTAEMSSDGVMEAHKGKGVGTSLIRYGRDYILENLPHVKQIIGWVAQENIPSAKTVLKNNFVKTSDTELRFFQAFNKHVPFVKYVYNVKNDAS